MKKNKDIAIGITTFLRDESLLRLIRSLTLYCPEFKLYVADQGESTPFKRLIYKGLQREGNVVTYIPFDSGISKTRKVLKEIVKEPYLVYMEDDFEACPKTNLYILKEILDENKDIGVVGGNLQGYAKTGAYSYYFDRADNKMIYFPLDYLVQKNLTEWRETSKQTKFIYADIVSDFTMWKKEVPNIFDEPVKTIEHTHVYLLVKYKTSYKVAFCPDCEIKHLHDSTNEQYNQFRTRKEDLDYIKKYWNITDFYQFNKKTLENIEFSKPILSAPKLETVEVIKPLPKEEVIVPIQKSTETLSAELIFETLNKNNIKYYLIHQCCLEAILQKDINAVQIGILDKEEKNKIDKLFPDNHFDIRIEYIKRTKTHTYKKQQVQVPMPVVVYLETIFHKTWEELQNGL
jgi:hypothetical protein